MLNVLRVLNLLDVLCVLNVLNAHHWPAGPGFKNWQLTHSDYTMYISSLGYYYPLYHFSIEVTNVAFTTE